MASTVAGARSALVVISPATTTRSVVTRISQATRLVGSALRQKSRTASLIWSATLSGWPIETDSLVKRNRSAFTIGSPVRGRGESRPQGDDYRDSAGLRKADSPRNTRNTRNERKNW